VVATGGSTNGVLHLIAIAHEFGLEFTIDDFDGSPADAGLADKPFGRGRPTYQGRRRRPMARS
jgi:dihydroxy-acid dehydratase